MDSLAPVLTFLMVRGRSCSVDTSSGPTRPQSKRKSTLGLMSKGSNRRERKKKSAGHWQLTPIILATQEAEIRRISVQSQPGQIVRETLSLKNPSQKRPSGVAQDVCPEFKPQYCQKKKRKKINQIFF
jgi:hypothetical protein